MELVNIYSHIILAAHYYQDYKSLERRPSTGRRRRRSALGGRREVELLQ